MSDLFGSGKFGRMWLYCSVAAKVPAAIAFALLIPVGCLAQNLTAEQVLRKVSQTYQGLENYSFVVDRVNSREVEEGFGSKAMETAVVVSRPGKARLQNAEYTLVSNGALTWVYVRRENEYTEVSAAPLLEEAWDLSPLGLSGWEYLRSYARAPLNGVTLRGDMVLRVGGRQIDCYVVRLPVSYTLGSFRAGGGSKDLWVSKSNFVVWRTQSSGPWTNVAGGESQGIVTLTQKAFEPSPVAGYDFRFEPPHGAQRVSFFKPNDGLSPWVNIGAWDAPAASAFPWVIGKKAPDFGAEDAGGEQFQLRTLLGSLVVLDFWASWCKPCQEELTAIQKLHDELASKGVVFLGINDESSETIRAFVKEKGYSFPMLLDTEQAVHQLYGVRWAPTTVVINRKGKIADLYIGAGGEAQLRQALKSAGLNTTP
jgi:cytochrome c biogenesis protein CcmG/thiol:disulfide interchange protein DsbE